MKEFNLEEALAGAKLVTRDGREIKWFGKSEAEDTYLAWVKVGSGCITPKLYFPNGKCVGFDGSQLDLFLAGDEETETAISDFVKWIKNPYATNEYQELAEQTAVYPDEHRVIYPTLGLTGEAGEVADKVKKVLRDKGGQFSNVTKLEIAKELGDVLWYVAILARDLGYSLDEVAKMNIDKLQSRQQRGKINGNGDNR